LRRSQKNSSPKPEGLKAAVSAKNAEASEEADNAADLEAIEAHHADHHHAEEDSNVGHSTQTRSIHCPS